MYLISTYKDLIMALFDPEFRKGIKIFFSDADSHMLRLYSEHTLVDENDCTSNFTSRIRDLFPNNFPLKIKAYSQKLPSGSEQKWGVDGLILLVDHEKNQGKICLFESKTDRKNWDYTHKNSLPPVSHFSTQLKRQKTPAAMGFVVWEQFYITSQVNSSCFMHHVAIQHKGAPTYKYIWQDEDVINACELQKKMGFPVNVGEIIELVCECSIGTPFDIETIAAHLNEIPPVANALIIEKQGPELNNNLTERLKELFSQGLNKLPSQGTQKKRGFRRR